jgi:hypothetical protein
MISLPEITYQYILQQLPPNTLGIKLRVAYILYLTEKEYLSTCKAPLLHHYLKREEGPIQKDLVQEISDHNLIIKPVTDNHLEYFSSMEMQCIHNTLNKYKDAPLGSLNLMVKDYAYNNVFYNDYLSIKDIAIEAGLNNESLEYVNENLYLMLPPLVLYGAAK